jgi:hypothetical protein
MVAPSVLPLRIPASYVAAVKRAGPAAYWRFEKANNELVADEIGGGHAAHALGQVLLEGRRNRTILLQGDESERGLFVETPLSDFDCGEYSVELWMNAQSQQHSGLLTLVELKSRTLADALVETPGYRMMAIECTAGEGVRWSQVPSGKLGFFHRLRSEISGKPDWLEKRGEKPDWAKKREVAPDPPHAHDNDREHEKEHENGHGGWPGRDRPQWGNDKQPWGYRDRGGKPGFPGGAPGGRFASGSRDFESRVYSKDQYKPGTWHHVVAVRERDRILLYLDGELQAETAASPSAESAEMNLIIGRYSLASGWLGRPFSGRIDEIAIYGRALTAGEIRDHATLVE